MIRSKRRKYMWDKEGLDLFLRRSRSLMQLRKGPLWKRCLWRCVVVFSKRRVKVPFTILVILAVLWFHIFYVGIYRGGVPMLHQPVRVCGDRARHLSRKRSIMWSKACEKPSFRSRDYNSRNLYYSDKEKRFVFCSALETPDTFWKQIVRYLRNGSRTIHGSALDVPRWQTRYLPASNMEDTPDVPISFLFTEDPYTRLWKAWVEKFFLLGFWFKSCIDESDKEKICQPDVKFPQLLKDLTQKKYLVNPAELKVHWRPQAHLCNICWLQPTFVGKMETFEEDAMCILTMTNYTWVLRSDRGRENETRLRPSGMAALKYHQMSMRRMRTLILENVAHWKVNPAARAQITLKQLVRRLWTAFQYLGYIPKDIGFPTALLFEESINPEGILTECLRASIMWPGVNSKARQEARKKEFREMVVMAYSTVSAETKANLRTLYEADFKSLGYPSLPEDLYPDPNGNMS